MVSSVPAIRNPIDPIDRAIGRMMRPINIPKRVKISSSQSSFLILNTSVLEAFGAANDVLLGAVQGIADLIIRPGMINVDFADVRTVMSEMGMAMMGMGMAMMMGMIKGSYATRQMMDKSSKMRKFGMKKNSEDSEMS